MDVVRPMTFISHRKGGRDVVGCFGLKQSTVSTGFFQVPLWWINPRPWRFRVFSRQLSGAMAPWLSNPTQNRPQNRGATPRQLGPGDVCETSSLVTIRKEAPGGTAEFPGVAGRFFFCFGWWKNPGEIQKSSPMFCWWNPYFGCLNPNVWYLNPFVQQKQEPHPLVKPDSDYKFMLNGQQLSFFWIFVGHDNIPFIYHNFTLFFSICQGLVL